jgi:hypothetical protein
MSADMRFDAVLADVGSEPRFAAANSHRSWARQRILDEGQQYTPGRPPGRSASGAHLASANTVCPRPVSRGLAAVIELLGLRAGP